MQVWTQGKPSTAESTAMLCRSSLGEVPVLKEICQKSCASHLPGQCNPSQPHLLGVSRMELASLGLGRGGGLRCCS